MKCPECLEEVVDGEYNCPYCGANLEEEMDSELEDEKGFASVLSVSDEQEAFSIKELLESNEIPVFIRPHTGGGVPEDYGQDASWGEILVNKIDFENSLSIIQKYMDAQRELLIQDEVQDEELEDEESLQD